MVNLNQLDVLLKVVEAEGFSGAAKALYTSQPSVSNHIRNLEASLGVQLVHRTGQGARPTPAGEVVADYARRVFELLDSLEQAVAEYRGLGAGRLTVAGTTSLGTYLLPRLIADFSSHAPKVSCQIRVGNEETVETWLMRGEVALGLCVGTPRDEQLLSEPLFDEQMILVAAAGSALAGRSLKPGQLASERFLLRERGSATRRLQEQALTRWGLEGVDQWDLWGADTLKEAVYQGLGLTLLSEHVTRREIESGTLVPLTIDPPPPARTVSLVRRADRLLTPPEQAFVGLLKGVEAWPDQSRG